MYYTDRMRRAFRSIPVPHPDFKMDVIDSDNFITLKIHLKPLMMMPAEDRKRCIIYALKVKAALESEGAVVLVVRDAEQKS